VLNYFNRLSHGHMRLRSIRYSRLTISITCIAVLLIQLINADAESALFASEVSMLKLVSVDQTYVPRNIPSSTVQGDDNWS
jgi:hypothetical protein